ncbi:MAG TPA: mycofactocin biosynthesis chaperone MftB [Acidimicrobiales bacterium]|nr:mycofactocin biosynthesis chaperone MftB [Acidimicrobiales bacterium]
MGCAASTEPGFDPARAYELHPDVALRPEPFGALAYHYGNRRLTFLRSHELVQLVSELGAHDSAAASMTALGVPSERRQVLERALSSLVASDVVRRRPAGAIRAG